MKKRSGGKFGTSHSTMTDAAAQIADIAERSEHITKIVHGRMVVSRGSSGSSKRVKITHEPHLLKVSITQNGSHQILFVHARDLAAASNDIEKGSRECGYRVDTK